MKPIVIYTSKYGSTEKYAGWIARALNCPSERLNNISTQELAAYDTVIYGGGVYGGKIAGLKKFFAKQGKTDHQKLVLFMVGMTNPGDRDFYDRVTAENLPEEQKGHVQAFSLHGDQLYTQMSGVNKLIMRAIKAAAEKKPLAERTAEDKAMIEGFGSDIIFSSRDQIEPIVKYVKQA